jgi:hypothetical protein
MFKCKHPFAYLHVEKEPTVVKADRDFEHVEYHLYCLKCKKKLTIKYARMIGGVKNFLKEK